VNANVDGVRVSLSEFIQGHTIFGIETELGACLWVRNRLEEVHISEGKACCHDWSKGCEMARWPGDPQSSTPNPAC
jgi:hypothetical protein